MICLLCATPSSAQQLCNLNDRKNGLSLPVLMNCSKSFRLKWAWEHVYTAKLEYETKYWVNIPEECDTKSISECEKNVFFLLDSFVFYLINRGNLWNVHIIENS